MLFEKKRKTEKGKKKWFIFYEVRKWGFLRVFLTYKKIMRFREVTANTLRNHAKI